MKKLNRKNVLKTLAVIGIALFSRGVALQASSDFTSVAPSDQQVVNEINRVKREHGVGGQVVLDNTFKDVACQQARQHNHTFTTHTRVVNGVIKTTSYNNYGEDEADFSSNVPGHTYYKAANAINNFWTERYSSTGNSHRISLSKHFDGVSVCSIKGAIALNFITYSGSKSKVANELASHRSNSHHTTSRSSAQKWHKNSKGWWYGNSSSYKKGWFKTNETWYWFNKKGYLWTHKGWEKNHGHWMYSNGSKGYFTSTKAGNSHITYIFNQNAYLV